MNEIEDEEGNGKRYSGVTYLCVLVLGVSQKGANKAPRQNPVIGHERIS